jgi:tellurite resistance protein
MSLSLPRESFVAIAAVAWADGWMKKAETEGLKRAAKTCGLTDADFAAVEEAAKGGTDLDTLDLSGLTGWQRAVTYAVANWLARIDGVVNTEELKHLKHLGRLLDLPDAKLSAAASAAFDIACLPGGDRPEKYDFDALAERLRVKVPSLVEG